MFTQSIKMVAIALRQARDKIKRDYLNNLSNRWWLLKHSYEHLNKYCRKV